MADDQLPEGWSREEWAEAERYVAGQAAAEGEQIAVSCECTVCQKERADRRMLDQTWRWMDEAHRRLGERPIVIKRKEWCNRPQGSIALGYYDPIEFASLPADRREMRRLVSEKLQAVGDALMKAWEGARNAD